MNETKSIYQRLIALQAELPAITKDTVNPFYKSKYATLEAIQQTIQPLLAKHGLGYMFTTVESGLNCTVFDTDNNTIDFVYPAKLEGKPQDIGSAISYAKRYALSAVLGLIVAGEDDDGNQAQENPKSEVKKVEHWMSEQEFVMAQQKSPEEIQQILNAKVDRDGKVFGIKKEYREFLKTLI